VKRNQPSLYAQIKSLLGGISQPTTASTTAATAARTTAPSRRPPSPRGPLPPCRPGHPRHPRRIRPLSGGKKCRTVTVYAIIRLIASKADRPSLPPGSATTGRIDAIHYIRDVTWAKMLARADLQQPSGHGRPPQPGHRNPEASRRQQHRSRRRPPRGPGRNPRTGHSQAHPGITETGSRHHARDPGPVQLPGVVRGRIATSAPARIDAPPMPGHPPRHPSPARSYRADDSLGHVTQMVGPFHLSRTPPPSLVRSACRGEDTRRTLRAPNPTSRHYAGAVPRLGPVPARDR
jgi:hypothetical protein